MRRDAAGGIHNLMLYHEMHSVRAEDVSPDESFTVTEVEERNVVFHYNEQNKSI